MAGRPRLPNEVAKITGAVAKNAGRFAGRSSPKVFSLGPAPKHYDEKRKKIWDEFNDDFPWLGRSDRNLVRMGVDMRSRIDEGDAPINVYAQFRMVLSSMGGTPVDRSKVNNPVETDDDPADEFIN